MKSDKTLAMSQQGNGQTVVLVHGWGIDSQIFTALSDALSLNYHVISIDLPGHGASPSVCPLTLADVAEQLLAQTNGRCHWIGWSLGGSLLMHMAQMAPQRFQSLTLIAANPCFVKQTDWCHGIDADVFREFEQTLKQQPKKTLKRFAALQALHSDNSKTALKLLTESLSQKLPAQQSLLQGLQILQQQDQRQVLHDLDIPMMVILGECDALIPVSIEAFYRQQLSRPQVHVIAGASHVPFLSHAEMTIGLIDSFLLQQAEKEQVHG